MVNYILLNVGVLVFILSVLRKEKHDESWAETWCVTVYTSVWYYTTFITYRVGIAKYWNENPYHPNVTISMLFMTKNIFYFWKMYIFYIELFDELSIY